MQTFISPFNSYTADTQIFYSKGAWSPSETSSDDEAEPEKYKSSCTIENSPKTMKLA